MPPVDRNSNPFATCWTSPSEVEYVPMEHAPEELIENLVKHGWWGQIVGPHGAGKSTLLNALEPLVAAKGKQWTALSFHAWRRNSAWRKLLWMPLSQDTLLVIDGYEQLPTILRSIVRGRCWRNRCGLLVTAHKSIGLPMLVEVAPQASVIRQVFRNLVSNSETPVSEFDFQNAFNACNGDIRQLFSNLYDLHEQRLRNPVSTNQSVERHVVQTMDMRSAH